MAHAKRDARKALEELEQRAQHTYVQPLWMASFMQLWEKRTGAAADGFRHWSAGLVYVQVVPAFDALRDDSQFAGLH